MEQLNAIAVVLRALVNSKKPPCLLSQVMQEYAAVEGEPLPFARLGYKSADALLMATKEFTTHRLSDGQISIVAKPNPLSAHVTRLVRTQKNEKKKPASVSASKPLKPAAPRVSNAKPPSSLKSSAQTNKNKSQPDIESLKRLNENLQWNYQAILQQNLEQERMFEQLIRQQANSFQQEMERRLIEQEHQHMQMIFQRELRLQEQAQAIAFLKQELAEKIMQLHHREAPPQPYKKARKNNDASNLRNLHNLRIKTSTQHENNSRVVTVGEPEPKLKRKSVQDRLKVRESAIKTRKMPTRHFTEVELVDLIYAEVKRRQDDGMEADLVPIWFANKFHQTIPEHWWSLLYQSKKFTCESNKETILFVD